MFRRGFIGRLLGCLTAAAVLVAVSASTATVHRFVPSNSTDGKRLRAINDGFVGKIIDGRVCVGCRHVSCEPDAAGQFKHVHGFRLELV